jgi:hypothetical protein
MAMANQMSDLFLQLLTGHFDVIFYRILQFYCLLLDGPNNVNGRNVATNGVDLLLMNNVLLGWGNCKFELNGFYLHLIQNGRSAGLALLLIFNISRRL